MIGVPVRAEAVRTCVIGVPVYLWRLPVCTCGGVFVEAVCTCVIGVSARVEAAKTIVEAGLAVMGHVGLTP